MKWKKEIIGNMTIKEIAQLAQVSSAAVSRYLNGGYISEEKKERIRAAIEKTGIPSVCPGEKSPDQKGEANWSGRTKA